MLLRLAVIVAVAYGLYVALLFSLQRSVMYPGRRLVAPPPPAGSDGPERYWLTAGPGGTEAWYLPPVSHDPARRSPALLFFHGNYELIDHWIDEFVGIRSLGFGVMLVEYPGYGRSEGTPSLRSIMQAGVAAYDRLVARPDVDPARIVLYGRSLGGGPASRLASLRPAAAVVLQSTFSSVRHFARGFLVPSFLMRDRFDNVAALHDFPGPVLIMHGRDDDVIPVAHAHRLAAALPTATLTLLPCAHNDCPPEWDTVWDAVAALVPSIDGTHASSPSRTDRTSQ
jgi:pimeloyl-ACP methyl ester carboxylesterase